MAKANEHAVVASNKKAFFNYEIQERFEAGIVLQGYEVKSIRQGHVTFQDSYARFSDHAVVLMGMYIRPYAMTHHVAIDPTRDRKLLLHLSELRKLAHKTATKELVLVPLSIYFKGNKVKVSLGLGKPKKRFDKRASLKEKDVKRDIDRALKRR